MHARSGLLQIPAEHVDDAVAAFTGTQAQRYKDMKGYRGFVMLADREGGKLLGVSFWDSPQDLEASEGDLRATAQNATEEFGRGETGPVREVWEVVYGHQA